MRVQDSRWGGGAVADWSTHHRLQWRAERLLAGEIAQYRIIHFPPPPPRPSESMLEEEDIPKAFQAGLAALGLNQTNVVLAEYRAAAVDAEPEPSGDGEEAVEDWVLNRFRASKHLLRAPRTWAAVGALTEALLAAPLQLIQARGNEYEGHCLEGQQVLSVLEARGLVPRPGAPHPVAGA